MPSRAAKSFCASSVMTPRRASVMRPFMASATSLTSPVRLPTSMFSQFTLTLISESLVAFSIALAVTWPGTEGPTSAATSASFAAACFPTLMVKFGAPSWKPVPAAVNSASFAAISAARNSAGVASAAACAAGCECSHLAPAFKTLKTPSAAAVPTMPSTMCLVRLSKAGSSGLTASSLKIGPTSGIFCNRFPRPNSLGSCARNPASPAAAGEAMNLLKPAACNGAFPQP